MRNVFIRKLAGKSQFTTGLMTLADHDGFTPTVAPAYAPWVTKQGEHGARTAGVIAHTLLATLRRLGLLVVRHSTRELSFLPRSGEGDFVRHGRLEPIRRRGFRVR